MSLFPQNLARGHKTSGTKRRIDGRKQFVGTVPVRKGTVLTIRGTPSRIACNPIDENGLAT